MHYYKRNIGDYAKKAGRLSMLEHGAYTLLIDACYDREQFPTLEEALDWAWARTEAEESAVKFVLSKFFTLIDGVYVQNRIKEELAEYKEKAETNTRIAKEREANRKKNKQVVNDSCEKVHESSPNQEPRTNNQEPINNNKNKREENFQKSEQDFIDKITTDNRKTFPITFDWKPNDSQFAAYCQRKLITPNQLTKEIFDKFVDKTTAKGEVKTEAQWCELLASYLKTCIDNPMPKKPNPHIYRPNGHNPVNEPRMNIPVFVPEPVKPKIKRSTTALTDIFGD